MADAAAAPVPDTFGMGGLRGVLADWRTFLTVHPRYSGIAIASGLVTALAGPPLLIPLLIALGTSPAGATFLGALFVVGPVAQLAIPALLRRTDGNLRALTIAAAILGETRGAWLAAAAALTAFGLLPTEALVALVGIALLIAGVCSQMTSANLQAWFAATLPEPERRFIAPRVSGLAVGVGAAVLMPVALLFLWLGVRPGPIAYVIPFAIAAIAGIGEVVVLFRLRRPGRVRVPQMATVEVLDSKKMTNFLRVATFAALGGGLAPYYATLALTLGLPTSAGVGLSAWSSAVSVVASTVLAVLLARRTAGSLLRVGYAALGLGWLAALVAFPLPGVAAFLVLILSATVVSVGFSIVGIAGPERIFRLVPGRGAIAYQGRYLGLTAASSTAGVIAGSALLALGGALPFIAVISASGIFRLVSTVAIDVSPLAQAVPAPVRNPTKEQAQ